MEPSAWCACCYPCCDALHEQLRVPQSLGLQMPSNMQDFLLGGCRHVGLCMARRSASLPAAFFPFLMGAGMVEVVLQMPRGNLEAVCPRALVLVAAAHALRRRRYARAWRLLTTHRIDLNLLSDLSWPEVRLGGLVR